MLQVQVTLDTAAMFMAVILITHDLTIVRQFSEYVYVMQDGEVKEHNRTETIFAVILFILLFVACMEVFVFRPLQRRLDRRYGLD